MPRGITPIRVRRRQSDAKWRASVAMCYNIMKNVIPNQKMMGRRKVSKALTLKETERHIINLERKLRELIEEKAPCSGKTVMVTDEDGKMRCATFEDIKRDFAVKQASFFSSNTASGKKRYNIPADIEASLVNLSKQTCQLFVVNRADSKLGIAQTTRPRRPLADRGQARKDIFRTQGESLTTPLKNTARSELDRCLFGAQHWSHTSSVTPLKSPLYKSSTPNSGLSTLARCNNKLVAALTSPAVQPQEPLSSPGFTPIKLPEFERGDPLLSLQETPAKTLESPFSFLSAVNEENPNLLCLETIDALELEHEHLGLTPTLALLKNEFSSSTTKPETSTVEGPKCRRRLEISYNSNRFEDQKVPDVSTDPRLDSLYLFSNQTSEASDETFTGNSYHSVAMPTMFDGLEIEKPARLTSLGFVEDSVGLSSDLGHIDLEPLSKVRLVNATNDAKDASLSNNQEVPDLSLDLPSQLSTISRDLHLVPEYEDLGIIYNNDSKEELFSFKFNSMEDTGHETESSQVVPSF